MYISTIEAIPIDTSPIPAYKNIRFFCPGSISAFRLRTYINLTHVLQLR